jgi:hypothetical protein
VNNSNLALHDAQAGRTPVNGRWIKIGEFAKIVIIENPAVLFF